MVPDASKTSLGLEYFLWDKDEEWTWSDDRLIHLGTQECARLGLINPHEVEDGTVVRMTKAYPVYDQSYQEHVKTIRRYLETFSNFQTIGRNGLHRYNNQDHSMLTGVYAARNVAGGRYDVWAVNTEKEYLEEGQPETLTHGDRLVPVPVTVPVDEVLETVFARLDPLALGAAVGLVSAVGLLFATAILLFKGGEHVGPTLSLLKNYLPGFGATWTGATIGCVEVGLIGFGLAYIGAWMRNRGIEAYAMYVRWRGETEERRHLLDKV
jgi:hypothetical protein